jgi:hypothetical protein
MRMPRAEARWPPRRIAGTHSIEPKGEAMRNEAIPWSAEAERSLQREMLFLRACWCIAVALFITGIILRIWIGVAAVAALIFGISLRLHLKIQELGEEARWVGRTVYPGSGMLANKPQSTRGLTKWMEHSAPFPGCVVTNSFHCPCGRPHSWLDATWYPGLEARTEEAAAEWAPRGPGETDAQFSARREEFRRVAGGGREVLICACGMGHFRVGAPR